MTTVTENDLKELKDLINSQNQKNDNLSDKIDQKIDKLTSLISSLAVGQAEIKGDLKALTETIKGVDKRLDGIEVLNRIVSGGFIAGILLALTKYLFFSNPHI